jgi:hypothetical protein
LIVWEPRDEILKGRTFSIPVEDFKDKFPVTSNSDGTLLKGERHPFGKVVNLGKDSKILNI